MKCYECEFFDAFLYRAYSFSENTGYCENKKGRGYGYELSAKEDACEEFELGQDKKKIAFIKKAI